MNLAVAKYAEQVQTWPRSGRHIMAQYDSSSIVVYQAYKPSIGRFAALHGYFGGEFSYTRMSWCKPNFLWMMYRSGWGTKEGQEITLAISIKRSFFDALLDQAVPSTFDSAIYSDKAQWSAAVASSNVRLQWDPDHNPAGASKARRAIQIGIRGEVLQGYGRDAIIKIEDISDFVAAQRINLNAPSFPNLLTPAEQVYKPNNPAIAAKLFLSE